MNVDCTWCFLRIFCSYCIFCSSFLLRNGRCPQPASNISTGYGRETPPTTGGHDADDGSDEFNSDPDIEHDGPWNRVSRRFSQRLRAVMKNPFTFDQLARKDRGVVIKAIYNRLLAVAKKILPGHGIALDESYRLQKMENVSVRLTLDGRIVH